MRSFLNRVAVWVVAVAAISQSGFATNATVSTAEVHYQKDASGAWDFAVVQNGGSFTLPYSADFDIRITRTTTGSAPYHFYCKAPSGTLDTSDAVTYATQYLCRYKTELGLWSVGVDTSAWYTFTVNGPGAATATLNVTVSNLQGACKRFRSRATGRSACMTKTMPLRAARRPTQTAA